MEHAVEIKQDVDDIKKFIHELCSHKANNSNMFARIVSGPVLNRSNEPKQIPERIRSGEQANNGSSRNHLSQGQSSGNPPVPVPATVNLLNKEKISARQVSNDVRLALNARPDHEPAHSAPPADRTTTALCFCPAPWARNCRRSGQDNEIARRGTDVDVLEPASEGALMEEGSWHPVRRHHRRKKNNK